jgi:hypothetical protein
MYRFLTVGAGVSRALSYFLLQTSKLYVTAEGLDKDNTALRDRNSFLMCNKWKLLGTYVNTCLSRLAKNLIVSFWKIWNYVPTYFV